MKTLLLLKSFRLREDQIKFLEQKSKDGFNCSEWIREQIDKLKDQDFADIVDSVLREE